MGYLGSLRTKVQVHYEQSLEVSASSASHLALKELLLGYGGKVQLLETLLRRSVLSLLPKKLRKMLGRSPP